MNLYAPSASRREFLQSLLATGVSIGIFAPGTAFCADDAEALPKGKRLIVRSAKPLNAEPSLDRLVGDWITPIESFYIRNHGAVPEVPAQHRVSVEGMVDRPLSLSTAELIERFPRSEATATLTCAGNRRNEFTGPKIGGVAWGAGAIGNAKWSGVNLASVLRHAGIQPGAKHVWFEGTDVISDKAESYPFGGSIPLEKALPTGQHAATVMLAVNMNDKPLMAEHGAPVRALVPGYIGARSVKWLKKILVSDRPSPNHYLAQAYKLITEETPAALAAVGPLYDYALNSVICLPGPETAVQPGLLKVQGFALPSGGDGRSVKLVELSADEGKSWTAAKTTSPVSEFCWVLWAGEVTVAADTKRILVRATDSSGQTQPREMPWNAKGYQFNAWHQVSLKPA